MAREGEIVIGDGAGEVLVHFLAVEHRADARPVNPGW
jgi:hypothetical protein